MTKEQRKLAFAAEIAEIERQLDALDYGNSRPAGAVSTTSFVKQPSSDQAYWNKRRSLVRQGFGAAEVFVRMEAWRRAHLVRGVTLPTKLKATTKPKVKSSPIAHRERPASNGSGYTTTKIKRQRVDDEIVANAWNAIPADRPKWAVTIRLSSKAQADALRQIEPLDWLRRSANRELKKVLGSAPSAIWSIGIVSTGGLQPHLHAVIAAPVEAVPAVYQALRSVGGHKPRPNSWSGWTTLTTRLRGHGDMIDIRPARDGGAAQYVLKNSLESYGRIHGKTIVFSNDLRQMSSANHNANRSTHATTSK